MADGNQIIEVRLAGSELSPLNVSARDTGKLITAVQNMIAAIVARQYPTLGLTEKEVTIGLSKIHQGSYRMDFATPYPQPVIRAYEQITSALERGIFNELPEKTVEALIEIRTVTRAYKTQTEFWLQNGQLNKLAEITQNTEIAYEPEIVEGGATLYGRVVRVGGENPPRAKIRFLDDKELNCNITQVDSLRVARELGQRLYETVGVRGRARWNIYDMGLVDFTVEEVLPYRTGLLLDNLTTLRNMVGEHLEEIDDIDTYTRNLRGQMNDG